MTPKLKRHRKPIKKSALLKRLKVLRAKKNISQEDRDEIKEILRLLDKKKTNKIESKKLNNNKQDEKISINININTGEPTRDIDWSTPDHYSSAAGTYRKSRIDNRKY
tara:strand:- start:64 stop:387 length:324 start_codon:yes stop_codon:yes gene_type:complete